MEPATEKPSTAPAMDSKGSKVMDVGQPMIQWPPHQREPVTRPEPEVINPAVSTRRSGHKRSQPSNFTCSKPGVVLHLQFVQGVAEIGAKRTAQAHIVHWTVLSVDPEDGTLDTFQPTFMPMALRQLVKEKMLTHLIGRKQ